MCISLFKQTYGVLDDVVPTAGELKEDAAEPKKKMAQCLKFGSVVGCELEDCPYSHDNPNSVRWCRTMKRKGRCYAAEGTCEYRHVVWKESDGKWIKDEEATADALPTHKTMKHKNSALALKSPSELLELILVYTLSVFHSVFPL